MSAKAAKKSDRPVKQKKQKEGKEADVVKKSEKQILAERKEKRRKLKIRGGLGVAGFLALMIWWGMQPLQGTMDYGLCRTYAETQTSNPETFRILSYENYGSLWKIFYSFTGAYGEQRSNYIECTFKDDPAMGRVAGSIKLNRKPISPEALALFNKSIPAIITTKPDLTIPSPIAERDLIGLKYYY